MAPRGEKGAAMMDVLFWAFFGIGFFMMLAMIVSVFQSLWKAKKEKNRWKAGGENSSILHR